MGAVVLVLAQLPGSPWRLLAIAGIGVVVLLLVLLLARRRAAPPGSGGS